MHVLEALPLFLGTFWSVWSDRASLGLSLCQQGMLNQKQMYWGLLKVHPGWHAT